MKETTLQTPRSVKNKLEEMLKTLEQSVPLQLVMKTMVRQAVPLQPMEVHGGADPPAAHGRDPTPEHVDGSPALEQAPARTCELVERGAHVRAGLLGGFVAPWGPMLEPSVSGRLHPMGRIHAGAVCEELQPAGRIHVGEVCGELSPVRGTTHWSWGRV